MLGVLVLIIIITSIVTVSITGNFIFFDKLRPVATINANSCNVDLLCETQSLSATGLAGEGNAYVCADPLGKLYRSVTSCAPVCGNGVKEDTEECDGADLGGKTCENLGINSMGGTLTCANQCMIATHECTICGNAHCEYPEEDSMNCPDDCV